MGIDVSVGRFDNFFLLFMSSTQVSLPSNLSTLYWCKLYKMPPITRKTHVIGVRENGLFSEF